MYVCVCMYVRMYVCIYLQMADKISRQMTSICSRLGEYGMPFAWTAR